MSISLGLARTLVQRWGKHWKKRLGNRLAIATCLLGALVVLPACNGDDVVGSNVTTEELAEQPGEVAGREITIRSTVQEVLGDSVFAIDDQRIFSDGAILVINNTGATFTLPEVGTDVQMTGEVMMSITPELEAQFGLDLASEFYGEYRDRPVVLAQSLAVAPDPGEVSANPEAFYNQAIAIEGEVEDIYGLTSLTLDEDALFGGEDLLVIGVPASEQIEGTTVVVTGKLRPFIAAEFERDYDLGWDADVKAQIEAEFTERPVMVADGLYPMIE